MTIFMMTLPFSPYILCVTTTTKKNACMSDSASVILFTLYLSYITIVGVLFFSI